MKYCSILTIFFLILLKGTYGQVTTFGDFPPEYFEFLPDKGARIIQGFRVDMGDSKYCIVYSKAAKGVIPDAVFVQQYVKNNDVWETNLSASRSSENTIFIWGRRGGFFTDAKKNGIAYTAFSEEDLSSGKRFIVGYFILYKDTLYSIEEDNEGKVKKSPNYKDLPTKARKDIEEAFSKLDKWKE